MGKQIYKKPQNLKQMPISCTIIFDHRNRTKPDQEGPVELRFIHNRKAAGILASEVVRAWADSLAIARV